MIVPPFAMIGGFWYVWSLGHNLITAPLLSMFALPAAYPLLRRRSVERTGVTT